MRLNQCFYYSLFYSNLCYCILIWDTTTTTKYTKITMLKKKVLRFPKNCKARTRDLPTVPLFVKHKILKCERVYYFKLLQFVHKDQSVHPVLTEHTPYHLRSTNRQHQKMMTNHAKQTLSYRITTALSIIENSITFHLPFIKFKKEFKDYLISNATSLP